MTATDRLQTLLSILESDPNDAFCLYGIAQEYSTRGDDENALIYYDRAIESDPNDAYSYFHKGRSLQRLNRIEEAIDTLKAGITAARNQNDHHAISELDGYLQELSTQS